MQAKQSGLAGMAIATRNSINLRYTSYRCPMSAEGGRGCLVPAKHQRAIRHCCGLLLWSYCTTTVLHSPTAQECQGAAVYMHPGAHEVSSDCQLLFCTVM